MIVSLNEIESVVLKACRGAGLSWGLAEEAAQAARRLAAGGWPWEGSLARLLRRQRGTSRPLLEGSDVRASMAGTALCPIAAGAAVSDLLAVHRRLVLHDVLAPLWLLPFAERHAAGPALVEASWEGGGVGLTGAGPIPAGASALLVGSVRWLAVELSPARAPAAGATKPAPVPAGGFTVGEAAWGELLELAALTCVPASLHSRLAGAGAGLSDND
jgi:hypothetical protein